MSTTDAATEPSVSEGSVPLTRREMRERELAKQAPAVSEETVAPAETAVEPEPVVPAEPVAPVPAPVVEAPVLAPPVAVVEAVVATEPVTPVPAPVVEPPTQAPTVAVTEPVIAPPVAEEIVVLDVPYAVPVPKVKDSNLPSLFGDDPEEEKIEVPVVAATYAREAPAAKYLDDAQPRRIVLPYAPEPPVGYAAPRQYSSKAAVPQEKWTGKAKLQVIGLSVLFYGLSVTYTVIYVAALLDQLRATGATSM